MIAPSALKDRMPFVGEGANGKEWLAPNGASFGLVGGVGSAGRLYEPGKQHRADRSSQRPAVQGPAILCRAIGGHAIRGRAS